MPWNNQNGGGGRNGGGGGPWGQGPQSGGSGNNQQPDLEELLKRSQDKFKQAMPGGGAGLIWLVVIIVVLGIWTVNSFHQIQPGERGVVLRFGKYHDTYSEGLQFIIWPIDEIHRVEFTKENKENFSSGLDGIGTDSVMLTSDQNLVDLSFEIIWKVSDPKKYVFQTQDPQRLVKLVGESAMREVVAQTKAEKFFIASTPTANTNAKAAESNTVRRDVQSRVQEIIQKTLNEYNAGILIKRVILKEVDPPQNVREAFQDIQKAIQEKSASIEEATRYKNQELEKAQGIVAKKKEEARAYKFAQVATAEGEARRFIAVYEQYKKAKDITRKRLYLETLEEILSKSNKIIIEQGGKSGVVPYLPLSELAKRKGG